jgi:hypothetical protein
VITAIQTRDIAVDGSKKGDPGGRE